MRWALLWVVLETDYGSIGFRHDGKYVLLPLLSGTLKVSSSLMCIKHRFCGILQRVKVSTCLVAIAHLGWGAGLELAGISTVLVPLYTRTDRRPKGRVGVAVQRPVSIQDGVRVAAGRGGQEQLHPATTRPLPRLLGNLQRPGLPSRARVGAVEGGARHRAAREGATRLHTGRYGTRTVTGRSFNCREMNDRVLRRQVTQHKGVAPSSTASASWSGKAGAAGNTHQALATSVLRRR